MANVSSLISLNAFTRRLLGKEGKDDDDYMRYMQIACDGIKQFSMHDYTIAVTKVVTVDTTTNTFDYPSDYVKMKFIATPIDGRWWLYTADKTIAPLQDDDGATVQSSLPNVAEYKFSSTLSAGGGYNRYYYTEDPKNRRFQVGGFSPDVVVLKYISNGIHSGGTINIPTYAQAALEAYVRWQIAEYDNPALSRIQWLKTRYDEERRKMRAMFMPTLQELKDAIYLSSGALTR